MENHNTKKSELSPVTKKILTILVLTAALMVPLVQVEYQISGRRDYENVAQKEVADGWGEPVVISSPSAYVGDQWVYPASSETKIEVETKEKTRGVFKVPVYLANFKTKVTLNRPPERKSEPGKAKKSLPLDHFVLPMKPISSIQSFKVKEVANGKEIKAKLVDEGLRVFADELPNQDLFGKELEITVSIRGTDQITYQSNAEQDKVKMTGNWPKPQFLNNTLPTESSVTAQGFEATWTLNAFPNWEGSSRTAKSIGLKTLWIGADYAKIERTVKYGILFIALTFLLVFIVEITSKARIHPLQYGMIGLSISLFYLLLLAISESLGFDLAYLISSVAVTGLIVFYVHGFLKQKKFVKMILLEQLVLTIFFYVLLSLEEKAFLVGSIGLFIALAVFMTITRKFDWYSSSLKIQNENQL